MSLSYERIYAAARQIPRGRVATYGQIAAIAGLPGQPRQVGYALHALPATRSIPWHRVINAKGEISARSEPWFERVQHKLLEHEGIEFDADGRVSLARFQWKPGVSRKRRSSTHGCREMRGRRMEVAMAARPLSGSKTAEALRRAALRCPGAEEGIACKGTALESTTVTIRKKAFLFVRATEARLKLRESQSEAAALASKDPGHYGIGANGWARVKFAEGAPPPLELLEKWVGESYRAVAGKELVDPSARTGTSKRTTRKRLDDAGR
jgi:methylated-DNA-protein-cysteine methyltransferase-like protein